MNAHSRNGGAKTDPHHSLCEVKQGDDRRRHHAIVTDRPIQRATSEGSGIAQPPESRAERESPLRHQPPSGC